MNVDIWQKLSALESHDLVQDKFEKLHARKLNARRAREISLSARQARAFFSSAETAEISVRPVLAFYGISSLARTITLLFRRDGGEETLSKGHGLETVAWSQTLSGDLSQAILKVPDLVVRSSKGNFSDLISATSNKLLCHVNSSSVDWQLLYDVPNIGFEINFLDLLARMPDVRDEMSESGLQPLTNYVSQMTYNKKEGAIIKITAPTNQTIPVSLSKFYALDPNIGSHTINIDEADFVESPPQFFHSYARKTFGTIPTFHLALGFDNGMRLSQLSLYFLISYFLGMLSRYYPSHWGSMSHGEKGDRYWPLLKQAQLSVQSGFPELVLEFINEIDKNR